MLSGQHALIAGGTGGIGYAIAHKLGLHGCRVTILSRDLRRLNARIDELNQEFPRSDKHYGITYDLLRPQSLERRIRKHLPNYKKINILVNCAGISQNSLLPSTSSEQVVDILNVNLLSPAVLCRLFSRTMTRLPNASIINVSSVLATDTVPGTSVYSASKAGLNKLTRNLAVELAPKNVRVNALMPSLVAETKIGQSVNRDLFKGREISADEVADHVLALVLDPTTTGQCIRIE
ncbi:hypothetical protein OGAPHI_003305 [Ogataea philodendri]|uniref:Uncharacterized protein n=1 Tax=Ogataea philodendri TaxID=1378263 RepID=A0A9P8T5I7_9ASCO|nr:uncharacterized protein OGAPHI_003305 [Ogataea philodendri]KAH3666856.1 hypothetical protein OGAPHI_003305 [Ogataea philodendri]